MILGLDVGGTQTDAVLIDGGQIVAGAKRGENVLSKWEVTEMTQDMFRRKEEHAEMVDLFERWTHDSGNIKPAFVKLQERLSGKENATLSFKSRPGVSYSFRANVGKTGDIKDRLFAIVDIVDDDPENRWLSVCFYGDMITDPNGEGNLLPEGLLGEDGYCFDLYEYDEAIISYLEQRIDEAYTNSLSL